MEQQRVHQTGLVEEPLLWPPCGPCPALPCARACPLLARPHLLLQLDPDAICICPCRYINLESPWQRSMQHTYMVILLAMLLLYALK